LELREDLIDPLVGIVRCESPGGERKGAWNEQVPYLEVAKHRFSPCKARGVIQEAATA
jgi:hypothetical protein